MLRAQIRCLRRAAASTTPASAPEVTCGHAPRARPGKPSLARGSSVACECRYSVCGEPLARWARCACSVGWARAPSPFLAASGAPGGGRREARAFGGQLCTAAPRFTAAILPRVGASALLPVQNEVRPAPCPPFPGNRVPLAQAIAELSTTEAFAARTSCLLCRGWFSCGPAEFVLDNDAWAQRHCSAGRMMCAQLPLDSQV
jgi:hypothetical protein